MKKLFISKSETELTALPQFCIDNNIQLVSQALIRFEAVPFTISKDFDAIFFSSPRSILFFLKGRSIPKNCFIACVGQGSATVLKAIGHNPNFIGEGNNLEKIALDLKDACKNKNILFPLSSRSLKSISSHFDPNQVEEVVVYDTINHSSALPECDFVVFTSPSNVESYLESNAFCSTSTYIAWGKSTLKALDKRQKKALVLDEPSEQALISLLQSLI